MSDLIERLHKEADRREATPTRVPTMNPPTRYCHGKSVRALLTEAADAIAARDQELAEARKDGLTLRRLRGAIVSEPEHCFGTSQCGSDGIIRAYSVRENLLCIIDAAIDAAAGEDA